MYFNLKSRFVGPFSKQISNKSEQNEWWLKNKTESSKSCVRVKQTVGTVQIYSDWYVQFFEFTELPDWTFSKGNPTFSTS